MKFGGKLFTFFSKYLNSRSIPDHWKKKGSLFNFFIETKKIISSFYRIKEHHIFRSLFTEVISKCDKFPLVR